MGKMPLKFMDLIDFLPAHIYWKDVEGKYLGCNKAQARALGFASPKDIVGKTDFDFSPKSYARKFFEIDQLVIESGKPHILEEQGSGVNEELTFLSQKIPLLNEKNEVVGVFGVSFDITNIKNKEQKLESEKQVSELALEHIIANLPGHVYWKDRNGAFLGCNKAQADSLGLTREEIIGKTAYDTLPFDEADKIFKTDSKVMESGNPCTADEYVMLENGTMGAFYSKKLPLKGNSGEVIGLVGISFDITDRKKLEDDLKESKQKTEIASKAKSEFIANMSHDIRTPITGMLGMIQDLLNTAEEAQSYLHPEQAQPPATPEKAALLNTIIETVQRDGEFLMGATDELLQLCNEILEVVRLESGKPHEHSESFNIRELLNHNIELFQPLAQHKKLDLLMTLGPGVPEYLEGMRNYLDRTLLNLLSNALKFTKIGSVKVDVTLSGSTKLSYKKGDVVRLQLKVKDTGIGIPEDQFDTIFEHFSRLSPAYEGVDKGLGLGLYTVKRYVDAMGGKVALESDLGNGTCFTVTLPFVVSDHVERSRSSMRLPKTWQAPNVGASLKASTLKKASLAEANVSVLIVEDNAPAAMAVTLVLKPFECSIDIAETGAEAVKKAEQGRYDLILMDIGLPDTSGIEATQKIRALSDGKKSQVPIVALTGHANNEEQRRECIAAGMQAVLSKPAQPLMLQSVFQRFVFHTAVEEVGVSDKAESANAPEPVVIDWKNCVRRCMGDVDFAYKLLAMMVKDLKKTQTILEEAYPKNDTEALRAELHRCLGGVAYLKLPQLEHALKAFQTAVKAEPQDPEVLETTYEALQNAIEVFWETVENESYE